MRIRISNYALFLVGGLFMFFSPFICKAQNSNNRCEWKDVGAMVPASRFNPYNGVIETYMKYVINHELVCYQSTTPAPASRKRTSSNKPVPNGAFKKVWVEKNVIRNQKEGKGMRIHAVILARNLKGKECSVNSYFLSSSNKPLKDFNDNFRSNNGNVAVSERLIAPYAQSEFEDFTLFMPYKELHLRAGKFELKFFLQLHCEGIGFLAESQNYKFNVSATKK